MEIFTYFILLLLIIIIIIIITIILYNLFKKDKNYVGQGSFMNVYKKNEKIVIKKYKYINIDSFLKYLIYSIITPLNYENTDISNKYSEYIFNSIKICKKKFNNCKFFPKIYKIDLDKKEYEQEYIENDFTIKNCPDYKQQLQELNKILVKTGYNLYDCKQDNFRIDNNGILKVIDPMLSKENPNNFNSIKEIHKLSIFDILNNSVNLYDNSNIFIYEIHT